MEIQLPEIIDIDHPERLIFTLKVASDRVSFSLYDPLVDGSYFYCEIPIERGSEAISSFKQCFFDNPFMASSFRKVYVINGFPEFTFVPEFLYKEEDIESLFGFNVSHPTGKILTQKLRRPSMVILHQMTEEVYQFLNRSLFNVTFIHYLSPFIVYFQDKNKNFNTSQFIVNLNDKQLDILCFSQGDFIWSNSFRISRIQDAVYYILFAWKQLKLDQIKDYVYIAGDKHEKVKLMKEIQPYIHHVIPVNFPLTTHFQGVETQDIPADFLSLTWIEL
ncbi:MAG: DUF3822 family protein [Dysgonamonadaceae bacterium]|jgi:hypothetical protein|nr:DUF3822 family protein [Dysgonamonadaceae bacterium]